MKHLICLGVIPGPCIPKDITSFLSPLNDELVRLALGVSTFDTVDRWHFDMQAYIIMKLGNIIAINKLLGLKGVNAVVPCQSCTINGVRKICARGTNYYVPLTTPRQQNRPSYDPAALPYRTHESFENTLAQMEAAGTQKLRNAIAKANGIREAPALTRV
jgi:hypothetical protein